MKMLSGLTVEALSKVFTYWFYVYVVYEIRIRLRLANFSMKQSARWILLLRDCGTHASNYET